MISYRQKLAAIHNCEWGYISDKVAAILNNLWEKNEDSYTQDDKITINNFYYRYRKQIFPKEPELWKLERKEFLDTLYFRSKNNAPVQKTAGSEKISYSRNERMRQKVTSQYSLFQ